MGASSSSLANTGTSSAASDATSLTLSMAEDRLVTCDTYTLWTQTTNAASSTVMTQTETCWISSEIPSCVYYSRTVDTGRCVGFSEATRPPPGWGIPSSSASAGSPASNTAVATTTLSGPAPVITASPTTPPFGTGPSNCIWTSKGGNHYECWDRTLEVVDWDPVTTATCTSWDTFYRSASTSAGKTYYPLTSTCNTGTTEDIFTSTFTLKTETWLSIISSTTTTLTSATITKTSLYRSGKPSATPSANKGSNDVYVDLDPKVINDVMGLVANNHRHCIPGNPTGNDLLYCGDTLQDWGVQAMKDYLASDINGFDNSKLEPGLTAIDPRILQNQGLTEYVLVDSIGQSFGENFTHGYRIENPMRLSQQALADAQQRALEALDEEEVGEQQEAKRYAIVCDLKSPTTTMDAQEVAAMTNYFQHYFEASFPSPTTSMVCTPYAPGHDVSMVCQCNSRSLTTTFPMLSRTDKMVTEDGSTLTVDDFCGYKTWPAITAAPPTPTSSTIPPLTSLSSTTEVTFYNTQKAAVSCNLNETIGLFNMHHLVGAASGFWTAMSTEGFAATSTAKGATPNLSRVIPGTGPTPTPTTTTWNGYYVGHYDQKSDYLGRFLVLEVQWDEAACPYLKSTDGKTIDFRKYPVERFVDNFVWHAVEAKCRNIGNSNVGLPLNLAGAVVQNDCFRWSVVGAQGLEPVYPSKATASW